MPEFASLRRKKDSLNLSRQFVPNPIKILKGRKRETFWVIGEKPIKRQ